MGQDVTLSIDIGGTHTRLALFPIDNQPYHFSFITVYPSPPYATFEELWKKASAEHSEFRDNHIVSVTMGCAGIVKNNVCHTTNLPWVLDGNKLPEIMGVEQVHLLNDLQAAAYGILALPEEDFVTLHEGQRVDEPSTIALLGAGTGLGEAFLVSTDEGYRAYPTEGGHADFAPINEEQFALCGYLTEKLGRVSTENVCSGPGLWNIYTFLRDRDGAEDPPLG